MQRWEAQLMKTFWISMAPQQGKARTVLVDAESSHEANSKVHRLGLYKPGDEFYIIELPADTIEHTLPRNRVCTEDELRSVGACTLGEVESEMEKIAESVGLFSKDGIN
jgi:hypothetical protein